MDEDNDTRITINSFLDWEMNVELNNIKNAYDRLSLLKHWALNFNKMQPLWKNKVIREINEFANKKEFYDIFAPIEEVEE